MKSVLPKIMMMLTLAEPKIFNMAKSSGVTNICFEAGKSYVLPMSQITRFMTDKDTASITYKVSRIENRIQNFHVNAKKTGTQRLLLFNGSGGYGDQIMTWPVGKILSDLGYDVHILADPGNQSCWWNFPWVKSISTVPMPYEQFKMFDYHCMFETVVNGEEHQDQVHPVDQMLFKLGINPDQIDPSKKVVNPVFTFRELCVADQIRGKDKIAIYQLSAANPIRSLNPSDSAYLLTQLAAAFPEWKWLAVYDDYIPKEYPEMLQCRGCKGTGSVMASSGIAPNGLLWSTGTLAGGTNPLPLETSAVCPDCNGQKTLAKNIQMVGNVGLREIWATVYQSRIVVCPDSMMAHVAGTMSVPCVGLWGLTDPANRVRYYKNHVPVFKREHCRFSPCYATSMTFPRICPPKQNRNSCDVLSAINPQDVIHKIEQIEAMRLKAEQETG